jgi:hypothetical protein
MGVVYDVVLWQAERICEVWRMLKYTGNTVYLNVHNDAAISDVTFYVYSWSDQSGIFNDSGTLKVAAMIYWPDYGHIWHYVTDVNVSDYCLYTEALG